MKLSAMPFLHVLAVVWSVCLMTQVYGTAGETDTGKCEVKASNEEHEAKVFEKIRPLIGKKYTSYGEMDEEKYSFTIGICADLEQNDAAVIQVKLKDDGSSGDKPRSIGSLKDSYLMTGTDWALLEYRGGESYQNHCNKEGKRTLILLSCDKSVGDGDAKMILIEEKKQKESDCYYLFEMKHKALCPVYSGSSVLSVGSIIVIIFICVAAVYLLVGFAYQRFVLGSKGLEQIPNYEFWKDFGNLQADGCDFICRTKERRNTGFRGIGDEQLDTVEETRDDNLLPM